MHKIIIQSYKIILKDKKKVENSVHILNKSLKYNDFSKIINYIAIVSLLQLPLFPC